MSQRKPTTVAIIEALPKSASKPRQLVDLNRIGVALLFAFIVGAVAGYCLARAQEARRNELHTLYPALFREGSAF